MHLYPIQNPNSCIFLIIFAKECITEEVQKKKEKKGKQREKKKDPGKTGKGIGTLRIAGGTEPGRKKSKRESRDAEGEKKDRSSQQLPEGRRQISGGKGRFQTNMFRSKRRAASVAENGLFRRQFSAAIGTIKQFAPGKIGAAAGTIHKKSFLPMKSYPEKDSAESGKNK